MQVPGIRESYGLIVGLIVDGCISRALPAVQATPDERDRTLERLDRFTRTSHRPAIAAHLIRRRHASEPASAAQPLAALAG